MEDDPMLILSIGGTWEKTHLRTEPPGLPTTDRNVTTQRHRPSSRNLGSAPGGKAGQTCW